jgi:hypothetical protein
MRVRERYRIGTVDDPAVLPLMSPGKHCHSDPTLLAGLGFPAYRQLRKAPCEFMVEIVSILVRRII